MNILIVGSLNTIFLKSYKCIFESLGHNVYVGNTSDLKFVEKDGFNFFSGEKAKTTDKLRRLARLFQLDNFNFFWKIVESREYKARLDACKIDEVEKFVINAKIDLVFFFWGTTLKKELRCLNEIKQKNCLSYKMILCVNTYPVRYILPKEITKNSIGYLSKDLDYFDKFDSVICPNKKMSDLLEYGIGIKSKIFIRPDFLHYSFFSSATAANVQKIKRSVVFLGNVDFGKRNLDDVSKTLLSIADMGIDVWVQSPCKLEHKHVKTFAPFTYEQIARGELGDFIRQFTASIVIYNNFNNLRTSLGYPTRFALATLGGGYILLPSGTFDGIEESLDKKQLSAIKLFKSIEHLYQIILELDELPSPNFSKSFTNIPEYDFNQILNN
ncbi:hypothetical protein [Shewanella mangrovisoli]|uniref:Glycosyltransferase family 1 protein n=1 Tax=Shewanella mangrovisoli TaxID=2864211 RepID=A0ABV4VFY5_9GAMM